MTLKCAPLTIFFAFEDDKEKEGMNLQKTILKKLSCLGKRRGVELGICNLMAMK